MRYRIPAGTYCGTVYILWYSIPAGTYCGMRHSTAVCDTVQQYQTRTAVCNTVQVKNKPGTAVGSAVPLAVPLMHSMSHHHTCYVTSSCGTVGSAADARSVRVDVHSCTHSRALSEEADIFWGSKGDQR